MTIKQTPYDLLRQASEIISQRGEIYGGIEDNFQLIADLASLRLGRDVHPLEVITIMVCVKNARAFSDPTHLDSRIDAINYEAFAAMFAEDYVAQKTASGANIGYKKKVDLKPANVSNFNVPKASRPEDMGRSSMSNIESIKGSKVGIGAVGTTTSSTPFSINLDSLEDEIVESK